jgi:hypothetical protein
VPHERVVLEAVRAGVVPAFFTVGFETPSTTAGSGT